jgi:uncharacterized protein (TIGR03086 family)
VSDSFKAHRPSDGTVDAMDSRIADHLANADAFTALVTSVPDDRWDAPSPCDGWTAGDVVQHVVDTQRDFLAGRGATLPPPPHGTPAERWDAHDATVREVLDDEAFATAPYDGYFGPTTLADTLRDFYGWDLVVHRWDLGRATEQEVSWTDAECAFVAGELATFGDQLYAEGVCKPALDPPADADEQTRVLALLGRRA